ncbi:MAG: HNH endonuclease [Candidatus Poribacteria bacterium]|nr:HNH endonuclease [Candidatus Poribacteria bacterium]
MHTLQEYLQMIENLRRYPNAPYKPCLLLAIIQLIEQGDILENRIRLSNHLKDAFARYVAQIPGWDPKNIRNPFYHLKNDGFWHLTPNVDCVENLSSLMGSSRSPSSRQLHELVDYGCFDEPFFLFLTQPDERTIIRQTIIRKYFSDYRQAIGNVVAEEHQIGEHRQLLIQEVAEHPFLYSATTEPSEENPVRRKAFRQEIMRIYNYTCAVCRLRVDTMDGESITVTDAAHIIPFSISYSDDIRNGISLCKLHHWVFDRGLISLNERYRVKVSRLIDEEGPVEWRLSNLHNKNILLPQHERLYPAQEALAWHRENKLRQ